MRCTSGCQTCIGFIVVWQDDEVYFNRSRITSILPLDYSVWVGTGEGNLITYDVFTHQGSKTPSDSSSFVGSYTDSFSALVGKEESASLPGNEGFDPVREAAMRVCLIVCASASMCVCVCVCVCERERERERERVCVCV